MKAYVACNPVLSRGIKRVAAALEYFAPAGVEIVSDRASADLIVHHVVGVQNFDAVPIDELVARDGKPYAIVQYCFRTTEQSSAKWWAPLWRDARLVWSYYDLPTAAREDGVSDLRAFFYLSPLGVDASIFRPSGLSKRWKIGTSGFVGETEGVPECHVAAGAVGGAHAHLGPDLGLPGVTYRSQITDEQVATLWSRCEYVAGLRRCEGFELPAYEALLAGSRPIVFDRPHYRMWLGEHAEYVPEVAPAELVPHLREIFGRSPRPVTREEREAAAQTFSWARVAREFWQHALSREAPRAARRRVARVEVTGAEKPKLLWIGDAVCHSGFAKVTHSVLEHLAKRWDVSVLGVNHEGSPHRYPYPIWPGNLNGEVFGLSFVRELAEKIEPDVVCILNDPAVVARYLGEIRGIAAPIAAYMPVDGPNVKPGIAGALNDLHHAIFYTEFGEHEARDGGYSGPSTVIPHGVDTEIFRAVDRDDARRTLQLELPAGSFVVGNVNRNQPRKRLDLSIQYFARWVRERDIPENVFLHLHCALKDVGWDLIQLADFFGVRERLIVTDPRIRPDQGIAEKAMSIVYSNFDVQISTTLGEGWGLPTIEGMACGVPQIVPEWSALAEWAAGAVRFVPVSEIQVHTGPNGVNGMGGVPSAARFVDALDELYRDDVKRAQLGQRALARAQEPRFRWPNVGAQFDRVLGALLPARRRLAAVG